MQIVKRIIVLGSLCAAFLAPAWLRAAPETQFLMVVHPDSTETSVDASFLRRVYLKKITRWPDGSVVIPVDQTPRSPARQAFSTAVLGRTTAAVRSYWQQRIFSGRDTPPIELASDAEVIDFVLKHPGSVGYVSFEAPLRQARVVAIR